MEEGKNQVSIAAMDSALAYADSMNKRMAVIAGICLVVLGLFFGCVLYAITHFNFTSDEVNIDSHEGTANYIGNDGDINNGTD